MPWNDMGLYNDLIVTKNLGSSVDDAKCLEQSLLLPNYGKIIPAHREDSNMV